MKNSVTFREKIGYGFGDMASSMFWKIFGMYLLFFYTKVFGITPAAAGTMFLVTRIWDSLNDPIMGLLADRTRSRWGRYRPYLLWGAFPFAAVGVLTFWTPDFGMTGKLAWAYITYTAMMMVYTMVNVPYASLLGVMTPDTKIRNTFSSYRMFFAYVGSLVTFMLLQPLVDFFAGRLGGGDTDRLSGSVAGSDVAISGMPEAWTCAVAVIGAICALLFWLCFRWTCERIRVDDAQLAEGSVGRDLKSLARNAPWWILLVAGVAVLLFNSIRDGVAIFYFTDYVRSAYKLPHLGWTLGTLYLLLGQLGNMAGVALAVPLAARIGKKGAFAAAASSSAKKLSNAPTHTIHYGYICDENEVIDEVMVSIMKGPRSFTAEDTVEINCHGGILVTRRVLDCVFKNGAAPAQPGEFTKRAFLNGRIDLSQAEAVMELISAKNRFAIDASLEQLSGKIKNRIQDLRSTLLDEIAYIEAALDDPEHISLEGYTEGLTERVQKIRAAVKKMADSFDNGKVLTEGIRTVIVGKPNAGKSSLLNALSGRQRAIVTEIAGTTRDTLEEQIMLGDLSLILVDTAGIRDTSDVVEKIGVEKAREAAAKADLLIYVADSSRNLDEDDHKIMQLLKNKKSIILLNKSDLSSVIQPKDLKAAGVDAPVLWISAANEDGLDALEQTIRDMFEQGMIAGNDEVVITNARQKTCLLNACESLRLAEEGIENGMPEDMLTIDMMDAYTSLGEVIGEEIEEDLVNRIFAKFCMGK